MDVVLNLYKNLYQNTPTEMLLFPIDKEKAQELEFENVTFQLIGKSLYPPRINELISLIGEMFNQTKDVKYIEMVNNLLEITSGPVPR